MAPQNQQGAATSSGSSGCGDVTPATSVNHASEIGTHFAESNEVNWFGRGWVAGADETGNLFKPAAIWHRVHALLDLAV